jgi:uncharacterized protein YjiS (DUF1127 family)
MSNLTELLELVKEFKLSEDKEIKANQVEKLANCVCATNPTEHLAALKECCEAFYPSSSQDAGVSERAKKVAQIFKGPSPFSDMDAPDAKKQIDDFIFQTCFKELSTNVNVPMLSQKDGTETMTDIELVKKLKYMEVVAQRVFKLEMELREQVAVYNGNDTSFASRKPALEKAQAINTEMKKLLAFLDVTQIKPKLLQTKPKLLLNKPWSNTLNEVWHKITSVWKLYGLGVSPDKRRRDLGRAHLNGYPDPLYLALASIDASGQNINARSLTTASLAAYNPAAEAVAAPVPVTAPVPFTAPAPVTAPVPVTAPAPTVAVIAATPQTPAEAADNIKHLEELKAKLITDIAATESDIKALAADIEVQANKILNVAREIKGNDTPNFGDLVAPYRNERLKLSRLKKDLEQKRRELETSITETTKQIDENAIILTTPSLIGQGDNIFTTPITPAEANRTLNSLESYKDEFSKHIATTEYAIAVQAKIINKVITEGKGMQNHGKLVTQSIKKKDALLQQKTKLEQQKIKIQDNINEITQNFGKSGDSSRAISKPNTPTSQPTGGSGVRFDEKKTANSSSVATSFNYPPPPASSSHMDVLFSQQTRAALANLSRDLGKLHSQTGITNDEKKDLLTKKDSILTTIDKLDDLSKKAVLLRKKSSEPETYSKIIEDNNQAISAAQEVLSKYPDTTPIISPPINDPVVANTASAGSNKAEVTNKFKAGLEGIKKTATVIQPNSTLENAEVFNPDTFVSWENPHIKSNKP